MPRERVSYVYLLDTGISFAIEIDICILLRTGRHQGPDIDGFVPGCAGVVQHAAFPCICASVQCSRLQTYQGNDETLNALCAASCTALQEAL